MNKYNNCIFNSKQTIVPISKVHLQNKHIVTCVSYIMFIDVKY